MDQQNNQLPRSGVESAAPQSPSKRVDRQKPWLIIGGVAGLVAVGVIAAVAILGSQGNTKQEYQDAIEAAGQMSQNYAEYIRTGVPRAALRSEFSWDRVNTQLYNELHNEGSPLPFNPVDDERLQQIEADERDAAEKIAASDKQLDRLVEQLEDEDVVAAYAAFKQKRQQLYGEGRDARQFVESMIHTERMGFACADFMAGTAAFNTSSVDAAKRFVMYAEGCLVALNGAKDSGVLVTEQQQFMELMSEMFTDAVEILRPKIAQNQADPDLMNRLEKKYGQRMEALEFSDQEQMGFGDLQTDLGELQSLLVSKRSEAPGTVSRSSVPQGITR